MASYTKKKPDWYDGKSMSDLGFSQDRINELRSHVSSLDKENFGGWGYSANTEHHFKELDNPTKEGSIEADMRKIGEHLGYKHAGTLNHDKVGAFIMENSTPDEVETPVTEFDPKEMEMSPEYAHARARAGQFREDRLSGRATDEMFGAGSTDFLEDYKMRLGKQTKDGNYKPNKDYPEG